MPYHTTHCGLRIHYTLRRSAKKNVIIRIASPALLSINIPPQLKQNQWQQWLNEHDAILVKLWQQAQNANVTEQATLPSSIWYRGQLYPCCQNASLSGILWTPQHGFELPQFDELNESKQALKAFLYREAALYLLPSLVDHAKRMHSHPPAMALTKAKTFWGICRPQTGIRLNWRLVGAPDWVVEYVCVHELCHLAHPNHSRAFWAMVKQHTPHTEAAKSWLQLHGAALFAVD